MMTDLDLLSRPDWGRFSDRELRRAIGLAKRRARQTFRLMVAWSEEQGAKVSPARADLYVRHCVRVAPNGQDLAERWDNLRIIDWCEDPRVYSFCHLYDRLYRRREGINPLPKDLIVLRARVDHANQQVAKLKIQFSSYSMWMQFVIPSVTPGDRIRIEEKMEQNQKLFNTALDYSMLTIMQMNAYMDEFLGSRS